ncbi:MAG: alpha/beta hydrolase family protein [Bryobacteraceae bacterium]
MRRHQVLALLLAASSAWGQTTSAREAFLKLIDRPRVPLAPETTPSVADGELEQFHFSYASDAAQRVPGIVIRPKDATGRLPVVIALHGTGGNKQGQAPLLKDLARRGFLGVAIDGRYHGERTRAGSGSAEYREAILRAYRTGKEHPFLYDTVWDVMRLVDWLETRPDVEPTRIGLIGFSKGGMEAYLAAAVDPRIRAVAPCIGVQSFRWALDHDAWQSRVGTFQSALNAAAVDAGAEVNAAFVRKFYDRVAPGIYSDFDGPAMLPLIAPRPLMVVNGDSDARTPRPGLTECIASAKKAYSAAGAEDKFEFVLQEKTGHRVNPESLHRAIDWFVEWLAKR